MRYFIGYLIKGGAKDYQEKLIGRICKKFDVRNLNEHVPAHFTLKAPFETEDIGEVDNILKDFCSKRKVSDIKINGIGSFREHIIFLNGESPEGEKTFRGLIRELEKIGWMNFWEYELGDVNFHGTLARAKDKKQFVEIMGFLEGERPSFDLMFDNIAIFENVDGKWRVYREFKLG
jgi:2'-5' RNA ligase